MKRGNVLVIGNSGVGKSTLINAVLGDEKTVTSYGTKGTTKKLEIYEPDEPDKVPFRLIDSIGFEPGFWQRNRAINAVKNWSKDCAKIGKEDTAISVIWFCVEGTSSKLFGETIQNISRATSMWADVPIVVVITKSYSEPDREKNIELVEKAFQESRSKRIQKNLQDIIPVVAETFRLNDTAAVPPEGIEQLIERTNKLLPQGLRASDKAIADYKLNRKRAFAQSVIAAATAGGAVVGAVPIPIPDASLLVPVEVGEINLIAKIYGIKKDENTNLLFESIVEAGTVSAAAKQAITLLKAIPGIHVAASVLNAVIAASIVATIGEGSSYAFEQIYLGNKSFDADWIKQCMESKFSNSFFDNVTKAFESVGDDPDNKKIAQSVTSHFIRK